MYLTSNYEILIMQQRDLTVLCDIQLLQLLIFYYRNIRIYEIAT